MSNKIGRFEILSEIAHSQLGSVYKASDPESGQTVALKTIRLELYGEQAALFVERVLQESESAKALNSPNLALLHGAGEIEGQFCASLEYVQGNSVATMLARKEGFSIWDLQDIARQSCQGLDHAHAKNVFHYSLEPAKVMVTWDGTVKILGFGISTMGAYASQVSGTVPEVLHYMSPEQLRDDPLDARSNVFSLGAILYEMVTESKAFQGEDADQVRKSIMETTPVAPARINRKAHPALSEVIMKALSKAPEERYQSGQELVNDLERCKESPTKAAAKSAGQAPQGLNIPQTQKKVPSVAATAPARPTPAAATTARTVTAKAQEKRVETSAAGAKAAAQLPPAETPAAAEFEIAPPKATPGAITRPGAKTAAAAAGWDGNASTMASGDLPRTPKLDPTAQFMSSGVKASVEALAQEKANMSSAATVEPGVESPGMAVDPMMAEPSGDAGTQGRSFSEIDELPPLKEVYVAPPSPPPVEEPAAESKPALFIALSAPEKPKVQPREVAKKAVTEIRKTPPRLFMYAVAAAVAFILLVVVGIAFHIHNEDSDEDSAAVQSSAPAVNVPAQAPPAQPQASTADRAPVQAEAPEPVTAEESPAVSVRPKYNPRKKSVKAAVPVPVLIPGQLTINSTPGGALVHVDGRNDPSWVTPYNLAGLQPGHHTVMVSKAGYAPETRLIEVASGSKSFLVVQLAPVTATFSVVSEPAGAAIFMDGKDTGRVTPTQIAVDKPGNHTFLIKKQGYLDETTTANLQLGQTFHFAPTLRSLGNTNEIKTVGKFKKMFGGGGDTAGMGVVSVRTQPKGAQVTINNRMLDKGSPVEFYLNPGTYVVDIIASGYKTIHRVITVDKGGKVVIDESMQPE